MSVSLKKHSRPTAPAALDGSAPLGGAHVPGVMTGAVITDEGMATAEYAVATLAACGFAGLLLTILRSDEVRNLLLSLITRALGMA